MKFSETWLRTLADPPLDSRGLADALTMAGLEVEALEPVAPPFAKVVVGEVLTVSKHPEADRLNVCTVNGGPAVNNGTALQIVCGAPDVRAGMRVPLALPGARLPGSEIKVAKVRSVESQCMLCSARELGISAEADGLLALPADAPPGSDVRAVLELDDQVLTIKPTPNRGDCLSIYGIARETATITGSALGAIDTGAVAATASEQRKIYLEAAGDCPRYCARVLRGVDARAATPAWMARRIARAGLRAISAVVDVTNYVMLEMGQPLHAFDLARVNGGIHVRRARAGESLVLLNEQSVALTPADLVIADEEQPLALAGVMGGRASAVSDGSRDILLESAFFTPAVLAGKARALGLASDAAYRFERGVDIARTRDALERATRLILDICGGEAGPVSEAQGEGALAPRAAIRLRPARARRVLGLSFTDADIEGLLKRLGFVYAKQGDAYAVSAPSYRPDLTIEEDLIEELARVYGYDRIPAQRPVAAAALLPVDEARVPLTTLRALLAARDYQEIISYSFIDRAWALDFCGDTPPLMLANPIAAHMNAMRPSLLPGLAGCLKGNLANLGAQARVRVFESGRCFRPVAGGGVHDQTAMLGALACGGALPEQWGAKAVPIDFYDVKADLEALLAPRVARFEPAPHPGLHPGRSARVVLEGRAVGWLGEVHPRLLQKYGIAATPVVFEIELDAVTRGGLAAYREFSRQPAVRRDISVEVAQKTGIQAMLDAIAAGAPGVVSEVQPFDMYRGKGIDSDKKSVAFKIVMQDTHKTLGEAEIDAAVRRILEILQKEFGATLRN